MGIFSTKEDKSNKILANFGIDLSEEDVNCINLFSDYYEKAITTSPLAVTGAKPVESNLMLSNLTLMQQNMLIIKQLDRLNKNIEKLIEK